MSSEMAWLVGLILLSLAGLITPRSAARADEVLATFTLDGLSFISFGTSDYYPIPSGTSLRFRFPASRASGSISFTVAPEDVSIPPLQLKNAGESLRFALQAPATGIVRLVSESEAIVELDAAISVTLVHPHTPGENTVRVHFTTERAAASNLSGTRSVEVSGVRLAKGARSVQLVAALTNGADFYPGPGAAVHAVVSGVFDTLPQIEAKKPNSEAP